MATGQQPPYVRLPALILTAVLLVLLAAGVVVFVVENRPADPAAPPPLGSTGVDVLVGECLRVNTADAADIAVTDCADPNAVYKVAVRRDTSAQPCPGSSYVTYTQTDTLRLCLTLNARQGECFAERDARVPCTAADASFQVARVVEGAADPNRCGESHADNAIVYPEPKLTLCRVPLH